MKEFLKEAQKGTADQARKEVEAQRSECEGGNCPQGVKRRAEAAGAKAAAEAAAEAERAAEEFSDLKTCDAHHSQQKLV